MTLLPGARPHQWKQHCLNFFPLPQAQGALRPTFGAVLTTGFLPFCKMDSPFTVRARPTIHKS